MVCVKVVSTPVKANLNSQYVASMRNLKCQEIHFNLKPLDEQQHDWNMLYNNLSIL